MLAYVRLCNNQSKPSPCPSPLTYTHTMPHTATPAKALIFYSHTPLRSTDQVPSVHELCMRGCSGQLMLEMGMDTTRRGNMIQLLGLGGCESIQQVRQLFYSRSPQRR